MTGKPALRSSTGVVGILGETDGDSVLSAACLHVGPARSVTGFAALCISIGLGVRHGISHDGMHETLLLFGVAGHAHVGTNIVAVQFRGRLGCE